MNQTIKLSQEGQGVASEHSFLLICALVRRHWLNSILDGFFSEECPDFFRYLFQ